MTGHEENEPLIGVDTNGSQDAENIYYKTNESYQTRNGDASSNNNNNNFLDDDTDTIIQMGGGGGGQRKSYGSLNGKFTQQNQQKLTYTWTGIDVFGEVPPQASSVKNCLNRLSCCFGGKRRDPIPRKHLLKNVAGVAAAGEILAVLGSSGAGKTTLLNALAFRSPPGVRISPTAVRALNGVGVDAMELRARCAYVQQDDLFIGSLTAREHLIFQAMLRMNRYIPYKQKVIRVEEVIQELSLMKCQHTIIGIPGRVKGLSGGERKRLAFASEALTDPPLFLCDEPTSGLDSFMAHSVLQVLKGMANKGKTVLLTIHQPSSELYELFDKILLMAEGRVAFMGTSVQASRFFSDRGAICPANYNPADYYVQSLAIAPGNEMECRESIKKICDAFAVSPMARDIQDRANLYKQQTKDCYLAPLDGVGLRGYRATWCTQFRAILWRSWLSVLKEPLLVKVRLFQTIMVAVLIGVIFYGQKLDQDGVMNINGSIFLFLTNMTFQNVFAVINVFCAELSVFLRESRARLYRTDAYFLGKTLAEVPLFIVVPLVFTTIAYPMIGLRTGWLHFATACLVVFLVTNVSTSFGYLISCASSSLSMALSVGPPVIIPFLLFGGFFLNSGSVPYYFTWLSYLSWFRYGNEALLINQWFDVKEGEIDCNRLNLTCPSSGQIILETLNFSASNFQLDFFALFGLIVLFRVIAFICLMMRARSKE